MYLLSVAGGLVAFGLNKAGYEKFGIFFFVLSLIVAVVVWIIYVIDIFVSR